MSDLVKISRLWLNRSGRGWGGKIRDEVVIPAGARVMLFDDRDKPDRRDGDADFSLVYGPPDDGSQQRQATPPYNGTDLRQPPTRGPRQSGGMSQRAERPRDDLDDEIPF